MDTLGNSCVAKHVLQRVSAMAHQREISLREDFNMSVSFFR